MSLSAAPAPATLDEWVRRDALPFSVESPASFHAAIDKVIVALGNAVELLGFGEPLHSGETNLVLRNRLFQHLVEAHGYCAIAVESSFSRGRLVNDYILGRGPAASYDEVKETGFSQGFGRLEANRELVDWMRNYNADPAHQTKLHFYGFDVPAATNPGIVSPRHALYLAFDYLTSMDSARGAAWRQQIDALLGEDARWENPASYMDPKQSPGLSSEASALRLAVEDLISELQTRRPEFVTRGGGRDAFLAALHDAVVARQFLNFHAAMARESATRHQDVLALRDAMMADNLAYILSRERGRGKVLVFAHNTHLRRGQADMAFGPQAMRWWPAGALIHDMIGARYAVIGSAMGTSEDNKIGAPEPGSLEARLAARGPAFFIPTHRETGWPAAEMATWPVRSGSPRNGSYMPLIPQNLTDFDWLLFLATDSHASGAWPLVDRTG
jgi:erythromycin esterase-like protein